MIPQSSTFDFVSHANVSRRLFCPCCSNAHGLIVFSDGFSRWKTRVHVTNASSKKVATGLVADRLSNEFEGEQKSERSSFTSFREDPKPTAPWVGAASWAFISLPKIKFELAPFRLFNLMGMCYGYTIFCFVNFLSCKICSGYATNYCLIMWKTHPI
ncbi:unnamed protein product [Brassica oleracea var. botrytis]|uniref:Uncharacterized protein n=2 Tax=Brassica TaxID=3705 RepID=A0A3P6F3A6_BRAOL|nr:unnamed protein product [Brassica napus]CDY33421.1 BnaC01g33040D [Brassica napus]VDD52007.1 unnamed protein product [Brassica oleracea]